MHGKVYSGDVYVRKFGTQDGFYKIGNVTELSTKFDVDKKELIGTGRDNFGQAIDSIVTPKPAEIEIKFNSFDKHALARALMGVAVDKAGAAQDISETSVKVVDGLIDLGIKDIDPDNFSLMSKAKKAIDKDKYELNHRMGLLHLKDDNVEKDTLYFSGKTRGRKSFSIEAGKLTSLDLQIRLDGTDRISGKDGVLEIAHAVLSANGDINWLSDDWWEAGLSGTLVKEGEQAVMVFTEYE